MSREESDLSVGGREGVESEISSGRRGSSYVPGERSGKWSGQEHMKYIAFIDFHRDRMRSKDKRRSNKFYQEMADFIVTRNALQCRSHHQKLEEKYTHAPKIVNFFKPAFDRSAYRDAMDSLQAMQCEGGSQRGGRQAIAQIATRSVETQTDIFGLHLQFISVGPQCYLLQPARAPLQPSFYYSHYYMGHHTPATTHSLPSTDGLASPITWESPVYPHDFGGSAL